MFRLLKPRTRDSIRLRSLSQKSNPVELPKKADIVILGGGSAGCNTLYQLAKRNVNAVLLESFKLTSGTTWHTAGLIRQLQGTDTDTILLNKTVDVLKKLENETGVDPGFLQHGSLFICHNEEREKDHMRQSNLGKYFGIESTLLDSKEVCEKIFPLLNPNAFRSALYCPDDGTVDPAMMCNALKKFALNKGAKIFEECPAIFIQTQEFAGQPSIRGVVTPHGIIETKCVINCTGAWSLELGKMLDLDLPIVPMKHAYVVSNSIKELRGAPTLRDNDASIYFRIQGESICLGGYERNPEILKEVASDFHFGLYDLNWDTFDKHIEGAVNICPKFGEVGIKTTICGPESFTPDHKPIMGEDPRLNGLFHNCAFNSAGMMLGAGCAEQIAIWALNGRPDLPMYDYDVRRFTPQMLRNKKWILEKTHETYAKYYGAQYPLDEPLAGRNLVQSPFHEELVLKGAFMEQRLGWERPRYFIKQTKNKIIPEKYHWYGAYGNPNVESLYEKELAKDCTYGYPESHQIVKEEALACRNSAVLFDLSYYSKFFISGPDDKKALNFIFCSNINQGLNKIIYTCALNENGGVEADVTLTELASYPFSTEKHSEPGYYVVATGMSAFHTWTHLKACLHKSDFNVRLCDVTTDIGILSVQGPKSKEIMTALSPDFDKNLGLYNSGIVEIAGSTCIVMRVSFVGELGYEIHIPRNNCLPVYQKMVAVGKSFDLKNAGFKALASLSCEKGYHLWNSDLKSIDTPLESNLGFLCRSAGNYLGKKVIEQQRKEGVKKQIAYFTLNCDQPLWGHETIWRNGEKAGYLRRGDYAFDLDCNMGVGYVHRPNFEPINDEFLLSADYELEVLGKRYKAQIHKKSPFDPKNLKMK